MSAGKALHPGINLGHTDPETHLDAEPVVFGFWVFLMADLVLFAVLFATYGSMAVHGVAGGPGPAELFDLGSPFAMTLVLLASSFFAGMMVLHVKYDEGAGMVLLKLGITLALGGVFLLLEGLDFRRLVIEDGAPPQRSGFLSIYFLLTGTHFVHVAAGCVWGGLLALQTVLWGLEPRMKLRLMRFGLYWHMLDIVWVGIFTFVFLFGAIG